MAAHTEMARYFVSDSIKAQSFEAERFRSFDLCHHDELYWSLDGKLESSRSVICPKT
jgi:hypothetical protein